MSIFLNVEGRFQVVLASWRRFKPGGKSSAEGDRHVHIPKTQGFESPAEGSTQVNKTLVNMCMDGHLAFSGSFSF